MSPAGPPSEDWRRAHTGAHVRVLRTLNHYHAGVLSEQLALNTDQRAQAVAVVVAAVSSIAAAPSGVSQH